jgi:hypothetical protein
MQCPPASYRVTGDICNPWFASHGNAFSRDQAPTAVQTTLDRLEHSLRETRSFALRPICHPALGRRSNLVAPPPEPFRDDSLAGADGFEHPAHPMVVRRVEDI